VARVPRVLLVDDTDDIRAVLRDYLHLGGVDIVGEAVDGIDGIAQAELLQPDWVILDWQMPRMNGIEALPKILAVSPRTKVVMFSSVVHSDAEDAALAAGATGFVEKNASIDDVLELVMSTDG
jgi:hypothetical protein